MSILHSISDLLGFNLDSSTDEFYGYEEPYEELTVDNIESSTTDKQDAYPSPTYYVEGLNSGNEILFCQPVHFDEIIDIIGEFTIGKSILINLDMISADVGQRAVDYICGSMLALKGTQTRVADNVFLFTPSTVKAKVVNEVDREIGSFMPAVA